ncbi:hypothetical protein CHS0354_012890 [Potamilus streckersoni]|uniref:protein-tyrosine-phosphatase n=1 Tax=Potamilus streckersoni TaxID=2493646 RepID=A0AAE0VTJ3_9BIVA|nr:hypothetical protein CHS0354_012890 [Potamilus streckersoni]
MLPLPFYLTTIFIQIYSLYVTNSTIHITSGEYYVDLEWPITNLTLNYSIAYNVVGSNNKSLIEVLSKPAEGELIQHRLHGLYPGQLYYIELNQNGMAMFSYFIPTKPLPPENLAVFNQSKSSVQLKWEPSPNSIQDKYKVFVTGLTNSSFIFESINLTYTNYTIADLKPGQIYNISVISYSHGESSNKSLSLTVNTVPLPPSIVSIKAVDKQSMNITWQPDPDSHQTGYKVGYEYNTTDGRRIELNTTCATAAQFFCVLTSLPGVPGQEYLVRVFAVSRDMASNPTTMLHTTKPEPIAGLTELPGNTTMLHLKWNKPSNSKFTSFDVYIENQSGTLKQTLGVEHQEILLTDLNIGSQYNVTITVSTGYEESEPVKMVFYTSPATVESLFTNATDVSPTSLTVHWERPQNGSFDHYILFIRTSSSNEGKNITIEADAKNATFSVLESGELYVVTIATVLANKESDKLSKIFRTSPNPPENVTASVLSSKQVRVKWKAPNGRVDNYTVALTSLADGRKWEVTITADSYIFLNLTPGTAYNLTVVSNIGELSSDKIARQITTNPLAVQNMVVSGVTPTSISVNWTEPVNFSVDQYELTVSPPDAVISTVFLNRTIESLTYTFQQLKPGRLYMISIVSIKSGTFSEVYTISSLTAPQAVLNLTVTALTSNELLVRWIVNETSDQDNFVVSYQSVPMGWVMKLPLVKFIPSQLTYNATVSSLYPGGTYKVIVVAVQNVSMGNSVSEERVTKGTTMPKSVVNLSVSVAEKYTVTLDWDIPSESHQDHYLVRYHGTLQDPNAPFIENSTLESQIRIQNLFPGERFEFYVYAVNEMVTSFPQVIYVYTEPLPPNGAHILSSNTTISSIILQWQYNSSATYVERWLVRYNDTQREILNFTIPRLNLTDFGITIDKLVPGQKYTFGIQSIVSEKYSDAVVLEANAKPIITTVLSKVAVTNSSIVIGYTVQADDIFDYFLFTLQNETTIILKNKSDDNRQVKFTSLSSGTLYTVEVKTVSGNESSSPRFISVRTLPNLPLVKMSSDKTNITLMISRPAGNIDAYRIVCFTTNMDVLRNITLPASFDTQTVSIDNLQPHQIYTCNVSSIAEQTYNTLTVDIITQEDAPSAVENLVAVETAPNTVQLNWNPPQFLNGIVTAYMISYIGVKESGVTDFGARNVTFTEQMAVFNNLKAGYTYTFNVRAKTLHIGDVKFINITLRTYSPPYKDGMTATKAMPKVSDPAVTPIETTTFFVNFTNAFSDKYGEILAYTVIVTEDLTYKSDILLGWKDVQLDRNVKTFQVISNCSDFFTERSTCNGNFRVKIRSTVNVVNYKIFSIGSETDCEGKAFCNGPLKPDTVYYVKLRAYTSSMYSDTLYSDPIRTAKIVDSTDGAIIGAIVGGVIAAMVVVMAVIIAVLFVRRRLRQKSNMYRQKPGLHNMTPRSSLRNQAKGHIFNLSEIQDYVQRMSADSDFKYAEQFEDLKEIGRNQPCTAAELVCNRGRNRFTNILPFDHSRVKLLPIDDDEGSDYINANYIPGYSSKREYIVTQGPLPSTRDDFWRMLWEHDSRNIVMLTKCVEKGREKCDHYWPSGSDAVFYGDLQVAALNETVFPDWTITEFRVSLGDQTRQIRHFHFTAWPDFGVPSKPQILIRFVRMVREKLIKSGGPVIVHCSAGVGRSGTFVVLDRLLQHIKEHDTVDIFSLVVELRKERVWMVQTEQQYICIHQCLLCIMEGREDEHIYQNAGHANVAFDDDEGINVDLN